MQVVATQTGFYGGSRRRVGSTFEMELAKGEKPPRWVVPADEAPAPKAVKKQEQKALSEMAKGSAPKSMTEALAGDGQAAGGKPADTDDLG